MTKNKGLINKYIIRRVDGTPINPDNHYFVLKYEGDGDEKHINACRKALRVYAEEVRDFLPELSEELVATLRRLDTITRLEVLHNMAVEEGMFNDTTPISPPPMTREWINIEERLPQHDDGESIQVLIAYFHHNNSFTSTMASVFYDGVFYDIEQWDEHGSDSREIKNVHHWMPIPDFALSLSIHTKQVTDEEIEKAFPIDDPKMNFNAQIGARAGAKWMRDLLTKAK